MIDKHGNKLDPAEVEQDKQRWLTAWRLVRSETPDGIRQWLDGQTDAKYREDMRRRLNITFRNYRARS